MNTTDIEFKLLYNLILEKMRFPLMPEYRQAAKSYTSAPTTKQLEKTYGSFRKAILEVVSLCESGAVKGSTMNVLDPEYQVLSSILNETAVIPRMTDYIERSKSIGAPQIEILKVKYAGDFNTTILSRFTDTYHRQHGYLQIPDYLLGCIAAAGKLLHRGPLGRTYIRIMSDDQEQLEIVASYLQRISEWKNSSQSPTNVLLCYDYKIVSALQHMNFPEVTPFVPSIDFVRGYMDMRGGASCYYTSSKRPCIRVMVSGNLQFMKQFREFMISLGVRQTTLNKRANNKYTFKMNERSVYTFLPKIYTPGCIHNSQRLRYIKAHEKIFIHRKARLPRSEWQFYGSTLLRELGYKDSFVKTVVDLLGKEKKSSFTVGSFCNAVLKAGIVGQTVVPVWEGIVSIL